MTVEAIKDAIAHLSEAERKQLVAWVEELEEEVWDRQMEEDFVPGGRGVHLLSEVQADIAAGRIQPMEEFLAEAKTRDRHSKTNK